MTTEQAINWGLNKAELTQFAMTDDDTMRHYKLEVRDLTNNKKYWMTWDLSLESIKDDTDEIIGKAMLAMANQDLEDFRNEEG